MRKGRAGAVKRWRRSSGYLLLLQGCAGLALAGWWACYRAAAGRILASESLTLEVLRGLEETGADVAEFQRTAALPVQRLLLGWLILLLCQMGLLLFALLRRGRAPGPPAPAVWGMMSLAALAAVPLGLFLRAPHKLLLGGLASYTVPYLVLCVGLPLAWTVLGLLCWRRKTEKSNSKLSDKE